jgi:glucose-fructose oxidoreductase
VLGFGICGCGGFFENAILPMMQRVENARPVLVYDSVNRKKVEDISSRFNIGIAETFEGLINSKDINVVYIGSPNVYHKEQTIAAARAGKHVLCEKPMGLNAAECQEMVCACDESNVKLGVDFCYPFAGGQQKVKELIDEGAIGEVSNIHISFNLGGYNKDTVGWRCDPKISGGGPMMDLAPHLINLAGFFFDDKVASVMAYLRPELTETEIELDVLAIMEMCRGVRASIDTSFVRGNMHNYKIVGTEGEIEAVGTMCWQAGGRVILRKWDQEDERAFEPVEGIEEHIRQFCQSVERDETPLMSGEVGLHVQAVVDAIYESGRTGKRCTVNLCRTT